MPVDQLGDGQYRALNPRPGLQPPGSKFATDPEPDRIADNAAGPAHQDQALPIERAHRGRIAGEQHDQQAVRRRISENETVSNVAMLPQRVEDLRKVHYPFRLTNKTPASPINTL